MPIRGPGGGLALVARHTLRLLEAAKKSVDGPPGYPGDVSKAAAPHPERDPAGSSAGPAADPHARAALARRTIRILFAAQILSGAGLAAGITVGALLTEDMLGSKGYAGVATALFTLGSAAAALLVGRLSQRSGRRPGLAAGYAVGAVGGAGVVVAAATNSVPLLLLSFVLYGSGVATNLQARYAGADLVGPSERGRAVSTVLVATTLGGVLGPNMVDLTGDWAAALGIRELAGPFLLATAAYGSAAIAVTTFLRPDPLLVARRWALDDAADGTAPAAPGRASTDTADLRLGAAAMIVTQIVMVAVMTMTPVHMRDNGHTLSATGLVIAVHIAAMFLPSPVTGRLVDRVGRRPMIAAGAFTLAAAGLLAALAPDDSMVLLTIALGLLGFGWNLGLIGGTALVTDATPLERRARTQGTIDLGVALAGAAGGLGSGFMVAETSYAALSIAGGVLALVLLPTLLATRPSPAAA